MAPHANPAVVKLPTNAPCRNGGQCLVLLVLLILVLALGVSLRSLPLPPDGLAWSLTVPTRGTLTVRLWTHDLAFSPAYTTGGLTRQTPGALRLAIDAQRTATTLPQRLAVLPVPAWPLLVPAALLALGVVSQCFGRLRY